MKNTGIVYLLTNTQLAARLVVSLYSLRQWYSGPVTLFTTRPESHQIGEYCAHDPHLRVDHLRCGERPGEGYVSSYLTKTALLRWSPYRVTVFLDADTVVCNRIDGLLETSKANRVLATAFCATSTMEEPLKSRLKLWRHAQDKADRSFQLKNRIRELLKNPYPAVNAGVFAVRKKSRFVERWDQLAWFGRRLPLPDEIALQLMLFEVPHAILGYQYNCHPLVYREAVGVHIWHFAGCSHLMDACRQVWLPVYEECRRKNIANIKSWSRLGKRKGGASKEGVHLQ